MQIRHLVLNLRLIQTLRLPRQVITRNKVFRFLNRPDSTSHRLQQLRALITPNNSNILAPKVLAKLEGRRTYPTHSKYCRVIVCCTRPLRTLLKLLQILRKPNRTQLLNTQALNVLLLNGRVQRHHSRHTVNRHSISLCLQ
jgi:hypothetical protein